MGKNHHKIKIPTREDSSTRFRSLGMTCRYVVSFNHTGCIRDVAGGRLPMNECVIAPGNHWYLIRCAEHHPYGHAVGDSIHPHGLYSERGMAMNHRRYIAWFRLTARVLFGTFPERHTGRSLRFRWWVIPFNHTGCIRDAPGTAHRPFPTVSLVGGTVHPHRLYSLRCMAMNHRRYIAWFHSTAQVVFDTWRAASMYRVVT